MVTKENFLNYEKARLSGEYNMFMDATQVMNDYNIPADAYKDILLHYSDYYRKWIGSYYTN